MRKLAVIISLLFSINLCAQSSFEGTVKYSARASREKDTIQIQIDFGPKAIKISIFEPRREHKTNDYLLVNFDSGKVFTMNHRYKTYTSHRLVEKRIGEEVPQLKTIAGYATVGEVYNEEGVNHIFGSMLSNKTIFYTSEKLMYYSPEEYSGNFELMMIQKNKIVLGAEIHIAPRLGLFGRMGDDEDSSGKVTLFVEAQEIIPKKFSANDFHIPADYVKRSPYFFSPDAYMDSVRMEDSLMHIDSAFSTPQVYFGDTTATLSEKPLPKKKSSKSPSTKKPTTKQQATRRKGD